MLWGKGVEEVKSHLHFSFGLFLGLLLPYWNNDQFKGLLFFLESPMTQNSQQLYSAG